MGYRALTRLGLRARLVDQRVYCFRRLRSLCYPMLYPIHVQGGGWRICPRVVVPEDLDKTAITSPSSLCNHNSIKRLFFLHPYGSV